MIQEYAEKMLRCPNDRGLLIPEEKSLQCKECGQVFTVYSDNLIDLMPRKMYPLKPRNKIEQIHYDEQRKIIEGSKLPSTASAEPLFGDSNFYPPSFRAFTKKYRAFIRSYLPKNGVLCDIGSGIGNYSLVYARETEFTVCCDADLRSLNYCRDLAEKNSIGNVLFIKCDYMQLPFSEEVFDSMICLDVLEWGLDHELRTLTEALRCLKSTGVFLADFHNKNRFPSCLLDPSLMKYSRKEIQRLLLNLHIRNYEMTEFGHAPIVPYYLISSEEIWTKLDKVLFSQGARILVKIMKS